jgi:starch synthase (maltosyl-transferring)
MSGSTKRGASAPGRRRSSILAALRKRDVDGRGRVVIDGVSPTVDGGRYPVKRVVGGHVRVEADVILDGHDALTCALLHRRRGARKWVETVMEEVGNDRFAASFTVDELGRHEYTVTAWADPFATWRRDLEKRVAAGQDVALELQTGRSLLEDAAGRATGRDRTRLAAAASELADAAPEHGTEIALDPTLAALARRHPDRTHATTFEPVLEVVVDRELARFSTWYELFPRSCSPVAGRHGTFADVEARLPYVAELGFDVLYLPPIHPIGRTKRKGPNNVVESVAGDPGSPWAIGAAEGGHKSIHPELGTLEDFRRLVESAAGYGIEIALDIAFQCSPDHPYVAEHPEWFRWRPDGTVQFAENPPKRYEDIYPFAFDTEQWPELWIELADVFEFWIEQGVRVFRVDNPHTKPLPFWEWCIGELKAAHPDLVLLSEAFTRPKVMHGLAKAGFTQSYTYFAWRNTKWELTEYFTELTKDASREYFRPNAWPNTPDILTDTLQFGGRPAFVSRLVLAATLAASYGIYGPAFELQEHRAREPGSEEYLDSEKYQLRTWDLERADSLRALIARVNAIRRDNPALQQDWTLEFHEVESDHLLCYSKTTDDLDNVVLVVVNLDPHHTQSGWVDLSLEALGLDSSPFQVHDLLGGGRFLWQGSRNYVELDPQVLPAHVFLVRRRVRSEREFDYFS